MTKLGSALRGTYLAERCADVRCVAIAWRSGVAFDLWRHVASECGVRVRKMGRVVVVERADQGDFVHLPRQPWKMLADLNAWHVGCDWLKLAADLGGCIRLQVEGVELTWPTPHEQEDAAICAMHAGRQRLGSMPLCRQQSW